MQNKLLEALNRMDALAGITVSDDENEVENLARDYCLLFNFINKKKNVQK